MTFKYETDKDTLIKKYEEDMLKKYEEIINKYANAFMMYGCNIIVGLYWDDITQKHYNNRIPISEGYSCYAYCKIQRDGKTVKIQSQDGEADYYLLSTTWQVSSVNKRYGKKVATLYSENDQIANDLEDFIFMLDNSGPT